MKNLLNMPEFGQPAVHVDRRTLMGGIAAAGALSQLMASSRTSAATPSTLRSHEDRMKALLGDTMTGSEEIAMLLYPGFTALDLVGPHFFFGCLMGAKVHLVTTENVLAPVASDLGLAIAPTVRMADVPEKLDVLFVPGGTMGTIAIMKRPDVIGFVASRAAQARFITSVCTGSMVLAKAGLLKGKRATSHWSVRDVLADFGAIPVDERFVEDGNVMTGAGVSAGIDFAIRLVEKLRGKAYAETLMLQAEYAPQPPFRGGRPDLVSAPVLDMMQPRAELLQSGFRALVGNQP
jgi:cyclohexyl-isocyanide hydratase